jgi:hypothetical protein
MASKGWTVAEKRHAGQVVALGCISCRKMGIKDSPAEVHHIRHGVGKGQKASNKDILPLCPSHHRNGGYGVAYHAGRVAWEKQFGTELELLEEVRRLLS